MRTGLSIPVSQIQFVSVQNNLRLSLHVPGTERQRKPNRGTLLFLTSHFFLWVVKNMGVECSLVFFC